MDKEVEEAIELLKANIETIENSNRSEVEKAVAFEQAKHNAEQAQKLFTDDK